MASSPFQAHGKILLSGEYVVLDGACALALPLKLGQSLEVSPTRGADLIWESEDAQGNSWFKGVFSLFDFKVQKTTDPAIAARIESLLNACVRQNPDFLSNWKAYKIKTRLDFPLDWGLGSSSTLVWNLAQWAEVDPYLLLEKTFGGSGYDIACADADGPLLYVTSDDEIQITPVDLAWQFMDQLWFVHSGKKQDSRQGIELYKQQSTSKKQEVIPRISEISKDLVGVSKLESFEKLMRQHESLISQLIGLPPIGDALFPDFPGSLKSCGAWGGDFYLAASAESPESVRKYFSGRGYSTVIPFRELALLPENPGIS